MKASGKFKSKNKNYLTDAEKEEYEKASKERKEQLDEEDEKRRIENEEPVDKEKNEKQGFKEITYEDREEMMEKLAERMDKLSDEGKDDTDEFRKLEKQYDDLLEQNKDEDIKNLNNNNKTQLTEEEKQFQNEVRKKGGNPHDAEYIKEKYAEIQEKGKVNIDGYNYEKVDSSNNEYKDEFYDKLTPEQKKIVDNAYKEGKKQYEEEKRIGEEYGKSLTSDNKYSSKQIKEVYKKEDYTEIINTLSQKEINKMNEAQFDMDTSPKGTPTYQNAKDYIERMENKAASKWLDKQEKNSNKKMNDKIRNEAYKKYMKEHPNSKMTLNEFLKK